MKKPEKKLSNGGKGKDLKVGDKFRLFGRGAIVKVTAIKNGSVHFECVGELAMTGKIPIEQIKEHL